MKTLITRFFLGLSLLFTGCESQQVALKTVAPSQSKPDNVNVYYKYRPPLELRPSKSVSGTYGSARECDAALLNRPTLFEPKGDAGKKTISTHPTFLFQLKSFSTKSLLFTLTEPGVVEPILEKKLDNGISGVIAIKLPQELPGLKTGKQYTWEITTLCNEPRKYNPVFNATIERILPTPSLKQKLAAATSDYKRAQLYDQFGIGYDAIFTVYEAYTANPKPPSNSKVFEDILKKNLQTYPIRAESLNSKAFEDVLKKNFLVQ